MSGHCPDATLIASILNTVEMFFAESGCPLTDAQIAAVTTARGGVDQMEQTYLPVTGRKRVCA